MPDFLETGTISVAIGSLTVTGVGTTWATGSMKAKPLDTLLPQAGGLGVPRTIVSDTEMTLVQPWAGPAIVGGAYVLRFDAPERRSSSAIAQSLADLQVRYRRLARSVPLYRCKGTNTNTPPTTPYEGDTYVIGTAPTGAWAGNARRIASWTGTTWDIWAPDVGDAALNVTAGGGLLFYGPSGGWGSTLS